MAARHGLAALRVGAVMGVAGAFIVGAQRVDAQAVRLGVVMDGPRAELAQYWNGLDPHQVERAYCIVDWSYGVYHVSRTAPVQDDTVFRVFALKPADVTNATPVSADFNCADGVPELHVHTPTTCMGDDADTCKLGGLNAYSCQPSRGDYEKLVQRKDPFGVIQCDKLAYRFYYPSDYAEQSTVANYSDPPPGVAGNLTPAMQSKPGRDGTTGPAAGSGARMQAPAPQPQQP
jgi:hypothetical protein